LIDLYVSFRPDAEYITFNGESVLDALQERIVALKPIISSLTTADTTTGKSARELLDDIDIISCPPDPKLSRTADDLAEEVRRGRWPQFTRARLAIMCPEFLSELKERCPGFSDSDYERIQLIKAKSF
jgi:hypothetical protein